MSDPQNDTNLAASANPADVRRAQLAALISEAFTDGISEQGTVELGEFGLGEVFDHPKPRGLEQVN